MGLAPSTTRSSPGFAGVGERSPSRRFRGGGKASQKRRTPRRATSAAFFFGITGSGGWIPAFAGMSRYALICA